MQLPDWEESCKRIEKGTHNPIHIYVYKSGLQDSLNHPDINQEELKDMIKYIWSLSQNTDWPLNDILNRNAQDTGMVD